MHRRGCGGEADGANEAAAEEHQAAECQEQWELADGERRMNDSGRRHGAQKGGADGERGIVLNGNARGCERGRDVAESGHCCYVLCVCGSLLIRTVDGHCALLTTARGHLINADLYTSG